MAKQLEISNGNSFGRQTEFDVIAPPFGGWDEKNPTPGENYTEIFGKVVHARRNLDSSYKLSQPRVQKEETETGVSTQFLLDPR